jgi:hypothetical protein
MTGTTGKRRSSKITLQKAEDTRLIGVRHGYTIYGRPVHGLHPMEQDIATGLIWATVRQCRGNWGGRKWTQVRFCVIIRHPRNMDSKYQWIDEGLPRLDHWTVRLSTFQRMTATPADGRVCADSSYCLRLCWYMAIGRKWQYNVDRATIISTKSLTSDNT